MNLLEDILVLTSSQRISPREAAGYCVWTDKVPSSFEFEYFTGQRFIFHTKFHTSRYIRF